METGMIKIDGMRSAQCAATVAQTLQAIEGVDQVNVSLDGSKATVAFDETLVSLAGLKLAVVQAGYEIAQPAHGEDGACCGGCGG